MCDVVFRERMVAFSVAVDDSDDLDDESENCQLSSLAVVADDHHHHKKFVLGVHGDECEMIAAAAADCF